MMTRVLLADDSETMGKIIQIILKPFSVHLQRTIDVKETLDALDSKPYDLLILASSLQGIKNTDELKQLSRQASRVPTLLITGSKENEENLSYHKQGFPHILAKPFTKRSLIEAIRQAGTLLEQVRKKEQPIPTKRPSPPQEEGVPGLDEMFSVKSRSPQKEEALHTKNLEERIIQSLCDPNNTLLKVLQHMIKEEIKIHSKDVIQKHCQNELRGIISEYLRGELKVLSQKKENITSI